MISFIIPAYNEAKHIYTLTSSLHHMFKCEVIVIDDGSDDGTKDMVADGTIVLVNERNYGKGYCLKRGTLASKGDYVVFLDSNDFPTFQLPGFLDGEFEVRIGNKFHHDSACFYPFKRRLMSHIYRLLVVVLFGLNVMDTQTGIKAFRGDIIRKVIPLVEHNGFVFDLELLYHLKQYKIEQYPVFISKVFGRVGSCDALNMLMRTLLLRLQLFFPAVLKGK